MLTSLRQGGALSAVIVVCTLASVRVGHAQGSLPSGWQDAAVGDAYGSSTVTSTGTYTVTGSGANIWGREDAFQFAYRALSGDFDVSARLSAFDVANEWSKAGLMVRESLAAGARNGYVLWSPGTGTAFQYRSATSGTTSRVGEASARLAVWVRLVRAGSRLTAYRSADGQAWTAVSSLSMSLPSNVYVGLAVTSREENAESQASFSSVSLGPSTSDPGGAWTSADVGSPSRAGSASVSGGTHTVVGSGRDIWGSQDQFHFYYQQVDGNTEIIARVSGLQATNSWAKAGVMIRESLSAGSRHAFVLASRGNGWGFQRRIATGGETFHSDASSSGLPGWVRLTREGSLVSAYFSTDGTSWRLIESETISMSSRAFVGLAVSSHDPYSSATATFTNVLVRQPSTSNNQSPTVTLTNPSSGATFTAPATIGLAASAGDSDGTIARVDFYRGSTLIRSDTTSPFTATWSDAPAGTYQLRAVATDNEGATASSATATVTVNGSGNQAPTVTFTRPTAGTTLTAPATVEFRVSASDSDGRIARVRLYQGSTLVKDDTTSPYSHNWSNVPAGTYLLRAVAYDDDGATAEASVSVTVNAAGNQAPTVAITAPTSGTSYTAPASMNIQATASDSDGSVTRVEFYRGSTLIGSDSTSPYSVGWNNVSAGSYTLTARAYDDDGATRTSSSVSVTVTTSTNQPPSVSITSPTSGSAFTAPANVTVAATASDSDGTVARVDFYVGSLLIGSDTTAPYTASWSNVAAGSYSLTAVARDNGNATRTSSAVSVTVSTTTTRPTTVVFNASTNHSTAVTSYTVAIYRSVDPATGTPVATRDLGKPTPNSSSEISVDISTLVNPLATGSYYAVVRAIGSGGTTASAPSSTFTK